MQSLVDALAQEQELNRRQAQELLAMEKSRARLQGALKRIADVLGSSDLCQELVEPHDPMAPTGGEDPGSKAFDRAMDQFRATLR